MTGRSIRKVGAILRETVLTVAALGGVACIVLVILAFTGGYSLIMFKTGSMSPTIPAGSVALVREIPASEVEVGDVLTVDRPGALPVTHRVTSVGPGPSDAERTITMKGDDNEAEDPSPYTIAQGRLVVGSVPHLARVIVWFGSPWVLGGITVGAALLVTWAFWPREPTDRKDSREGSARHAARVVAGGAAIAIALAPVGSGAAQAAGPLQLRSDLAPGVHGLDAETPLYWHVDADAVAVPSPGELVLSTSSSGDAALGMRVEIRGCDVEWRDGACAEGEQVLRPFGTVVLDGAWREVLATDTPATAHVRLALTAEPTATADGDERVELAVRASAGEWSEEVSLGGEGSLATTGSGSSIWGFVLAPIAIGGGLLIAWMFRRQPLSDAPGVTG